MKTFWMMAGVLILAPAPISASFEADLQSTQIVDAKLGTSVVNREITEAAGEFAVNDRVYLWLKVTSGGDEALRVTWKTGDHVWTSDLTLGGSPWRTWCYKTAALAGSWTVTVADSQGNILKEMKFEVK